MSTGYGWEGIRQGCATLLGARHVPERLWGGVCLQRGAITNVRPLWCTFTAEHASERIKKKLSIFNEVMTKNLVAYIHCGPKNPPL